MHGDSSLYLAGLCKNRLRFFVLHRLHEPFGKRLRSGGFLIAQNADRLEAEQRIGLAAPAGGLLEGDAGHHATQRNQSASQPGGVLEEQHFAGYRHTHQQRQDVAWPQQEKQHRLLAGLGPRLAVLGTVVVEGTVGTDLAIF